MRLSLSTERLAEVSARHPWRVIFLWLLVIAGSVALIVTMLAGSLTTQVYLTNNPESKRADELLESWRGPDTDIEIVVIHSDSLTVDDPAFQAKVEGIFGQVMALPQDVILNGLIYYALRDETFVSEDRHSTVLPFALAGDQETANENVDQILAITHPVEQGQFRVLTSGKATVDHEVRDIATRDLQTGEAIGVPIALVVLVLVFGALAAAGIPIVIGVISIVVALGVTALLGQAFTLSFFVTNIITMAGLALGIDYSLFIISRYREERALGRDKQSAIYTSGATAGRAVFFSGTTVVFALLGMLIVPLSIFRSLGAGAIIVVLVSVLVSLTLLPAMISLLGDRVNWLRVPFLGRGVGAADWERGHGFWNGVTNLVMRHPVISLIASCGVLMALAVPYFDINPGSAGVGTLPRDSESNEAFTLLQNEFDAGLIAPTQILILAGNVGSTGVQDGIDRLTDALSDYSLFGQPSFESAPDRRTGLVTVAVDADPTSDEATNAIRDLREKIIPEAFADSDAEVLVTGETARGVDYIDTTDTYTPIVIAFVLGLSFVLLTIVFRSLVVPLKAIVMNLLSVGASYGALVLVFQKGFLNELFGFQQVDVIEAWVPLFTFSILFGLSMDYHVFLLSRIRECFNKTDDNKESVAFGVRSTAGIITGAALIMASVFGGVALGDLVMFQQMGFGLAVAVLLDATIVRSVLVPAAMELLGRANWYLPNFLRWLPEVRTEAPEAHPTLRPGTETR